MKILKSSLVVLVVFLLSLLFFRYSIFLVLWYIAPEVAEINLFALMFFASIAGLLAGGIREMLVFHIDKSVHTTLVPESQVGLLLAVLNEKVQNGGTISPFFTVVFGSLLIVSVCWMHIFELPSTLLAMIRVFMSKRSKTKSVV